MTNSYLKVTLCVAATTIAAFVAYAMTMHARPPSQSGTDVTPIRPGEDRNAWLQREWDKVRGVGEGPLHRGNPDQAMAQARQLMEAWQAAGGDWKKVPADLQVLPDQQLHPNPDWRNNPSFAQTSHPKGREMFPEMEGVAFVCPLYTETVSDHTKGVEGETRLAGFHIVGFTNGEVKRVPVDEFRVMPLVRRGQSVSLYVYPGMAAYTDDLPLIGDREGIAAAWAELRASRTAP